MSLNILNGLGQERSSKKISIVFGGLKVEVLYKIAEDNDILTVFGTLFHKKAFSVIVDDICAIVIDCSKFDRVRDMRRVYAEEIGHCITHSFYPLWYCCDPMKQSNIAKAERRALDASYELQVPLSKLQNAIKKCSDDYEIAEQLDVDMDVLREAVTYYHSKGLLNEGNQ